MSPVYVTILIILIMVGLAMTAISVAEKQVAEEKRNINNDEENTE